MNTASIIPLSDHPANTDKAARIVAADPVCQWTVYAVTGGFVATLKGLRAIAGIFPSQSDAMEAAFAALAV